MSKENERLKSSDKDKRSSARSKDRVSTATASKKSSASKSPEKSDSAKRIKSSGLKSGGKGASRSPKRSIRSANHNDPHQSSTFSIDATKSTPEFDDLSSQGLTALSSKTLQKTTLRKLVLSGNNLRSIAPGISELINLEHLDLSRNPLRVRDIDDITCLPLEMRSLKNLKFLSLSECNLRHIPTTVWLLVSIQTLDLSRNKIGLLVPDIGNLHNLRSLNISQCNLTTLPGEIGFCAELEEITLMANQIESLPDNLKDCKNLKQLRISFRSFNTMLDSYMENLISKGQIKSEHIPVVVFELENLMYLDLKKTKLNHIPENNLIKLRELYLDNNYFDRFADGVLQSMVSNLRVLTMSHNLFKEIPMELNCLLNLEILDLSHNLIAQITNNSKLASLKELDLSFNKMSVLNDNVKHFRSLRKLNLERNQLQQLAESLFDLENLVYLNLSYNCLVRVSTSVCKLKLLASAHLYDKFDKVGLWMLGNPLKIPPKQIWQTTRVENIYEFLAGYNQKNLDYVYYSKLIFMGASGVGKSKIVDAFFNNVDRSEQNDIGKIDYKTQVARRLYKRTPNKVEWMILDLGCDETYRSLHPLLFSSIDPDNEPTVFVIVYNHTDYTPAKYEHYIGQWLESILTHCRSSETKPIQLKLIGILNSAYSEEAEEYKLNTILNQCGTTIDSTRGKVVIEKQRILNLIGKKQSKDDELKQLEEANSRLDLLLKRRVYLNESITILEDTFKKENLNKVVQSLESITIRLNKMAPLDLGLKLKNFMLKFKKKKVSFETFMSSLRTSSELEKFIKMNQRFQLDPEKLLHYSKTMGKIFWMKYADKLNKQVYLHFDYLFNSMKLFLNHGLSDVLGFSGESRSIFQSLGLYSSRDEFSNATELALKYGVFEWKLINGICFNASQLNQEEVAECIDLLQDLLVIYKSETQSTEERSSYFKVVVPSLCSMHFGEEKNCENSTNPAELFSDNFETYFLKLDRMRVLREKIKKENAFKKRRELWNFSEEIISDSESDEKSEKSNNNELELTQSKPEQQSGSKLFNLKSFSEVEFSQISSDTEDLTSNFSLYEANCLIIECKSSLKFGCSIFSTLSSLVQELAYERVDWCDTLIARDLENSCFRIQLNTDSVDESVLKFEIKSIEAKFLLKLKTKFLEIIRSLFNFYPGLFFCLTISEKSV